MEKEQMNTTTDYRAEHKHIYDTRLGILCLDANAYPKAMEHNLAVMEADHHIAQLKTQGQKDAIARLRALRDTL
jgi:hypothetical protein